MENESKEMISVSKEFLESLMKKLQDKDDHIRGLEAENRELVAAVNQKD
jgi:hypothetical protein